MTGPLGAAFITGLSDSQILTLEELADEYMIEILTQVANHYADRMLAAAGLPLIATIDDAPPPAGVSPEDFAGVPADVAGAIAENILPLVAEVYTSGWARTRANMIAETNVTLPPVYQVDAVTYLRNLPNGFSEIGDNLWSAIRSELADGFEQGESIPELATRVRAAAGTTARTATLVARTAVVGAANRGSYDMARSTGLTMQKEWLATMGEVPSRTRPTHVAADGQRVDLNAKFIVGGYDADIPGDSTLPPSERYSCRCSQGFVMPRDPELGRDTGGASVQWYGGRTLNSEGLDRETDVAESIFAREQRRQAIARGDRFIPNARVAEDPDWGTAADPAMKLTVTQLRDLEKANETGLAAGLRKADLARGLRLWERDNARTILPPMARELPDSRSIQSDNSLIAMPDGPALTGAPAEGRWDKMLDADTGPGGVPVRDLITESGYRVKQGRAFKLGGVGYLVETSAKSTAADVARLVGEMRDAHRSIPNADRYNQGYAWMLGRNPMDAESAKKYGIPNFRSAATSDEGMVTQWDRKNTTSSPSDADLRHETGHNADYLYAHDVGVASTSKPWAAAIVADRAPASAIKAFKSEGKGNFAVTPKGAGVTKYGGANESEDWAESYEMYTRPGRIGTGTLPGGTETSDVFFRDMFPNRAAIFDGLFPEFGTAQRLAIEGLRRGAAKIDKAEVSRREVRAAVRARQVALDRSRAASDGLADVDELVAKQADVGLIEERLQRALADKVLTKVEADAVRKAVATGDQAKVDAALVRVGKKYGLTFGDRAGDITTMGDGMRGVGATWPAPGSTVRVVRRGATWTHDGETIDIEPTLVRAIDPAAVRALRTEGPQKVAGLVAELRRHLDSGPLDAARVDTLAGRANVPAAVRAALTKAAAGGADDLKRAIAAQLRAAKVKAQGVVGRATAFDPDTMEVRGGGPAPATGTRVKVTETGYVTDVDGQPALLLKTIVEPVATKAPKAAPVKAEPKTPASAVETSYESRRASLSRTIDDEVPRESTAIEGGITATVRRVRYGDRDVVIKQYPAQAVAEEATSDAEELAALVLDAVGVRVPAVVRINSRSFAMEFVEGKQGGESGVLKAPAAVRDSYEGRLLGLADAIVGHRDRNGGNWMRTPSGELVAIDNGGAFGYGDRSAGGNPFVSYLMGPNDQAPWKRDIPLPDGIDLKAIRKRIEALRPEFVRLGRETWYRQSLDRLTEIEKRVARVRPTAPNLPTSAAPVKAAPKTSVPASAIEALYRRSALEPADARQLGGGSVGDVRLLTYADGSRAVEKVYGRRVWDVKGAELKRTIDAEVLGPRVLEAFGLRTAPTIQTKVGTVYSEFIEGKTGADLDLDWNPDPALEAAIYEGADGRLLGAADYVMGNTDRNSGNFLQLADGHLAGIDHGSAFFKPGFNDFMAYLDDGNGKLRTSIPELRGVDFGPIRARLVALEPEFTAIGREAWHKAMMRRLTAIEKAASRG